MSTEYGLFRTFMFQKALPVQGKLVGVPSMGSDLCPRAELSQTGGRKIFGKV